MSKQLYEEALADVKKLKEVAEDNAKRAILEAVTPRIRDLIENQLLGDNASSVHDIEDVSTDDVDGVEDTDVGVGEDVDVHSSLPDSDISVISLSPQAGDEEIAASAISLPDAEGKVTLDLDALQLGVNDSENDELELSYETMQKLGNLLVSNNKTSSDIQSEVNKIVKTTNSLRRASSFIKESKGFYSTVASTLTDVKRITKLVSSRLRGKNLKICESTLQKCQMTLSNLMEQSEMRLRNKNLFNEAGDKEITLKLTGLPDDIELEDVGIDLITGDEGGEEGGDEEGGDEELDLGGDEEGGDEEGGDEELDLGDDEGGEEGGDEELDLGGDEEGGDEDKDVEEMAMGQYGESRRLNNNVIVEIDEGMLRREISRMKSLREEAETKAQSWGHGPGDVSDDFEDDDLGDPFVDIDLTTEGDSDPRAEGAPEEKNTDEDDVEETSEGIQESRVRRAIVRERRIQTEAKKKAQAAKKGKVVAEKQKKNAKTQSALKQANKKVRQMKEAYTFFARKHNASVLRENNLRGMLAEARSRNVALVNEGARRSAGETSNLRTKLTETNLFNAKLLFTNKLLQNESLTKRQKAEVIERLDEARSEREVKLVYETAVKTFQGSTRKLSESATPKAVIGSASRTVRPAATLNESFEVDRWARLAGIK